VALFCLLVLGLRIVSPGQLRLASGAGDPSKRDAAIGTYLMSDRSQAERDAMARALWKRGVPPEELDALEGAFESCKRLPREAWQRRESTTA